MHDQYIDELIKHKLKQLELLLDPEDWKKLSDKFSAALENHIAKKLATYEISPDPQDWPKLNALLNEAFDIQIKHILSSYEIDLNPSDWGLIATELDENPLDTSIARGLHNYEIDMKQEDWNMFASQLDESAIDTGVREQLSHLELEAQQGDWEAFESRIEENFDEQVKSKLADISLSAAPQDWNEMARLMDGDAFLSDVRESLEGVEMAASREDWRAMEDKLNQPLYTTFQEKFAFMSVQPLKGDWKSMEALLQEDEDTRIPIPLPWYAQARYLAAASVLILFLIAPFWIGKDGRNPATSFISSIINGEGEELGEVENSSFEVDKIENAIASRESTAPTVAKNTPTESDFINSTAFVSGAGELAFESVAAGISSPQRLEARPALNFEIDPGLIDGIPFETKPQEDKSKKADPKIDMVGPRREGFLREIPFKAFANPWMMGRESHSKGIEQVSIFKRRRFPFRIGLFASSSKSAVELNELRSTSSSKLGETFRGGLRAEFNIKGNLHFVTGLNYEKRHFDHAFQYLRPGFNSGEVQAVDQFISADLQLVQLPLLLRAYAPSKGNLSLYVQGGLVPMVSLKESYRLWEGEEISSALPFQLTEDPSGDPQTQDWSFNTYPGTINLSAGLEYRFDNKLAIQAEPYTLLSLQQTKGSGSLNLRKKMYTVGLAFSVIYGFSGK
ncbi:MAG: outer membrane beta-barrel protein [Bacteroidia bacterium]|nr:outer membrane beta-barrel protein [Bacteroidia bacterium]